MSIVQWYYPFSTPWTQRCLQILNKVGSYKVATLLRYCINDAYGKFFDSPIISGKVAYPELTFAAFLNCSKLEVEAFRSRLLEAVDSASDPESRSENSIRIVKLLYCTDAYSASGYQKLAKNNNNFRRRNFIANLGHFTSDYGQTKASCQDDTCAKFLTLYVGVHV